MILERRLVPALRVDTIKGVAANLTMTELFSALRDLEQSMTPGGMEMVRNVRTNASVQVIWGARDPALGTFLLEGMERYAPRVRIHCIPHAGHWVQNEAPEEVNRTLLAFLGLPSRATLVSSVVKD